MAAETQYTANTGIVTISTANSNLDGSGTLGDVITGASNGTLVKTVTIKTTVTTAVDVVRLFAYDGTSTKLIAEVEVPVVTKSSRDETFSVTIPLNYVLKSGGKLKAGTQVGQSFNVIAEGLNFAYYGSIRPESTKFTANTSMVTISTANSNLDGSTGTYGTVITATSSATSKGTRIKRLTIKAQGNTTPGMIRIFVAGAGSAVLLKEIPVPSVTKSSNAQSFTKTIDFDGGGFSLVASGVLKASTEIGETFNIIAEGEDWTYPA